MDPSRKTAFLITADPNQGLSVSEVPLVMKDRTPFREGGVFQPRAGYLAKDQLSSYLYSTTHSSGS